MREFLQNVVSFVFGGGMMSNALNFLDLNPSQDKFADIWNIVCGIYDNVCVPIGLGLVLIYFVVNLMERSMQYQQFDLEHIFKALIKLVVGMYFIKNGLVLMATLYSLGLAFLHSIVNTGLGGYVCIECGAEYTDFVKNCICGGSLKAITESTAGDALARSAWTELTGEPWEGRWGFMESLGKGFPVLLQLLLPWALSWGLQLIVIAVCFFRLIEFYILTCAAPIALSDFFTEGTHSNGWKFVKNYIAMCLQMGIMMLAIVAFNGISAAFLPTRGWEDMVPLAGLGKFGWFIFVYLAAMVSCAAVLLKSRSLAKEIVGVQ